MRDRERKIIDKVLNKLVQKVKVTQLLQGEFVSLGHIGDADCDTINAEKPGHAQTIVLINILKTRDAFFDLYKVLKRQNQADPAEAILKEAEKQSPEIHGKLQNISLDDSDSEKMDANPSASGGDKKRINVPNTTQSEPKIDELDHPVKNRNNLPVTGKGLILPINIIKFKKSSWNRAGGDKDNENIKKLFPDLGFTPFPTNFDETLSYNKKDIWTLINAFKAKCNQTNAKACIVFIGSHGEQGQITTSDMKSVGVNKIIAEFYHDKFKCMENIPKIFIVQACRDFKDGAGDLFEDFEMDTDTREELAEKDSSSCPMADTIVIKSNVPGYPSYRTPQKGSYLMYYINEVFSKHLHGVGNKTVRELFEEVVRLVEKNVDGQVPELKTILFEDYYL